MNVLIYPTTLFSKEYYNKIIDNSDIYYIEDDTYFKRYHFNKKKIILHRASMKKHQQQFKKSHYIDFNKVDYSLFKNSQIILFDPNDLILMEKLLKFSKKYNFTLLVYPSPGFILTTEEAINYGKGKNKYYNSIFYKFMRNKTQYLMKNNKPIGGKWSFDTENRKKLPKNIKIPNIPCQKEDKFVKEAISYTNKYFHSNYGNTDFFYPTDRKEALKWLNDFISKRAKDFGPYQDSVSEDNIFLFHSILSSSFNIGLITPTEACEKVIDAYNKKKISIESCEGFIRQVISWREYVRMIYLSHGHKEPNYFNFKRKLNKKFYEGKTGIFILDNEIQKAVTYAYSHHIIRLMVFSNLMTMLEIQPSEMFRWFSELFIDAYDWVMWANVYGMGTYADGGMTMARPYISSSNYLKKMSDYKVDERIDDLYYHFLGQNEKELSKIYATAGQVKRWKKFSNNKKEDINKRYKDIVKDIF